MVVAVDMVVELEEGTELEIRRVILSSPYELRFCNCFKTISMTLFF